MENVIKELQRYKDNLVEVCNNSDYHYASKISRQIDKVDDLIASMVEFQEIA